MRQIRIAGIYVGSRTMMEKMLRVFALHRLRPVVDAVFPFEEAVTAYRTMEDRQHFGKIGIAVQKP